jgi:EmrB/QacA subfamily drug resistance transporter
MAEAVSAAASPGAGQAEEELDPRRWKALAVVLVAGFMTLLDVSIVNVAIPSISSNLRATSTQIEFVLAGYQLAYAVTLITGGRLGDIFGRKRLFMIGVGGFVLASASCGLAQSGTMLVASRIAQGLLAALMYPQILSTIQVNFGPRERPKAFGLFGGVIGLATITGPLVGGLLIQGNLFNLDWRPIFLVNVPVGIGAIIAAAFFMHETKAPHATHLDVPGVLLSAAALFLLAYPLVEGRTAGWPLWTWLMFVGAAVLLGLLALYLVWDKRRGGDPLVEPSLFADRGFVVGMGVILIFISGLPAFFLTFSIFLQVGHGFSALQTGLTTMPFALGSAVASVASARVARRLGNRILALGSALLVIGMGAVLLTLNLMGTAVNGWELVPALLISGLGLGCVIAPLVNVILGGIHSRFAGSASGVLNTFQQIGGALGVAIIGVIFFGLLSSNAGTIASSDTPAFASALHSQGLPVSGVSAITAGVSHCFSDEASSNDINTLPASCQSLQQQGEAATTPQQRAVGTLVQDQASLRLAQDFDFAFSRSVIYNLVVWGLSFFLVLLLPRPESQGQPQWAAGGH